MVRYPFLTFLLLLRSLFSNELLSSFLLFLLIKTQDLFLIFELWLFSFSLYFHIFVVCCVMCVLARNFKWQRRVAISTPPRWYATWCSFHIYPGVPL